MVVNVNGLNDIAHVVTKCVALVSNYRGHVDIVQLRAEGLHCRPRHAINTYVQVMTNVPGRHCTSGDCVTDPTLTIGAVTCLAITVIDDFAALHRLVKGLSRWLFTTNHKDIGTMYLWFSFSMFILGGAFAMIIRAELFQPGLQLVEPGFFNQMTTLHGLIMVFGAIMPSFVGLANWLIPMMIGAPDMALPRMNNWSFWITPANVFVIGVNALYGRRRAGRRLDVLRATVDNLCRPISNVLHFLHSRSWSFVHHGLHQYHCNCDEYAGTRHDLHEDAIVCLDLADNGLPASGGDAGIGWCGDHDVDGCAL